MYLFAHHDPLWRALVVRDFPGNFQFSTSWRVTYLNGIVLLLKFSVLYIAKLCVLSEGWDRCLTYRW
jgi:hypothetical protein